MTTGVRTVTPGQIWERSTNDGGTYGWYPYGLKYNRSWSGGDSPKNYTVSNMTVPREDTIVKKRDRRGSEYYVVKRSPPRVVKKRVYTRKFRQPNSFSSDNRKWLYGRLHVFSGTKTNQTVWQLNQIGYVPSFSGAEIFDSNKQLDLIGKLSEKIQDTDFSAAISLAEIDKTCQMIADRAKTIAKSMAYLRKKKFKEALRVLSGHDRPKSGQPKTRLSQTAGARILEVQYGWKPLVQDMYEGAVWLAALQNKPNCHRYSVRSRAVKAATNSGAGVWHQNPHTEVRRQIIAYLEESSFSPTLNLWNPAEILWERTPWSFVSDWVIPIGSYLSARGIASKLVGTFVTTTHLRKRCVGGLMLSPSGSVEYTKARKYDKVGVYDPYWSEEFVTRVVSSTLNVPLPTFKGLGQIASWQHCLNAVSLLAVASKASPDKVLRSAGRL